jgi:acyl carrier protein
MTRKNKVRQTIFQAIDEVNETLPPENRIAKSEETILFDVSGQIDSLGLTILIVALEQNIEKEFDVALMLADQMILPSENEDSPFQTVGTLVNHISFLLEEKLNESAEV